MPDPILGNGWWVAAAFGPGVAITAVSATGVVTTTGSPADPVGVITYTVTDPLGVSTVNTISKTGAGVYSLLVYCPTAGTWECVCTAAYPGSGYGSTVVDWTVGEV